jgi:alpha-L-arabinofuranosidase
MTRTRMVQASVFFCLLILAVVVALHDRYAQRAREPENPSDSPPATRRPFRAESLRNSGFEDNLAGWEVRTYGAPCQVEIDAQVSREGKHSLRVSAAEPSDTAFCQELLLKPCRWYRFTGWVRTRDLDPHGASVCGTFQIQRPEGRGIIASGVNHRADTDWTEVPILFEAPLDGRTRIVAFFTGFGKGTGTAWFDDLRIEEVDVGAAPIVVTRDFLNNGEISPLQYGQFIEYLCDLVPSMWAEKLYDGSFEGLSPYTFVYLKETDFREKPWHPSGATNRAEYTLDRDNPVSGEVCQKINVKEGTPCTVGIAQDGIAVERGKACTFSCYLRGQRLEAPVQVRLHHEGKLLASCAFQPTCEWKKYSARLIPGETDTSATLTILFHGPATLWLDNASLMPENNVGGWRRDVVEAVRALRPGVIRFGGSALDEPSLGDFSWKDTIGDLDHRKPFRAWGGLQPTGPGLEEIVQLCRLVSAEPLICVRFTKRTPQDAAEQVQYFNGPIDTPMGKWRAKNGHPEPYHIKYWQVGNERGGKDYEARLAAFCKAMKETDPSITLLSSYPSEGVLREAGEMLGYVCPHQYNCANLEECQRELDATRMLIGDKQIKVAVTEWNTTAGDWGHHRGMLWTLQNALACSRYHNLLHRQADLVDIANRSNLTNSFCSGIVQTDNRRLYKTPTYYAQQLYATLAGNRPLKIESPLPPQTMPDISATLSADGKVVTLFAVNATLDDITRPIDLSAFDDQAQELAVWTLTDKKQMGEPDVTNSFAEPERVAPVQSTFKAESGRFEFRFPALSVTVIQWHVV